MTTVVTRSGASAGFEFVIQQTDQYGFSKETKTRIRRQAMKAVGEARRQSGVYGKSNLLQAPPDLSRNAAPLGDMKSQPERKHEAAGKRGRWRVNMPGKANKPLSPPPPMPLSGLEAVMRDHGLDIMDLSALTAIHIGPAASQIFATQPANLPRIMARPQTAYFRGAQARYGHYPCLDDAIVCLAGKAQYILSDNPRISVEKVISSYSRAIKSLQIALRDPKRWLDPEVLCATEMLALVELLESGSPGNWSPHISGASRLLRARGAHNCKTDFERNLFMSLLGPIVCESFLNNEACFLEEDQWRGLLQDMVRPNDVFSDFCPIAVEIGDILFSMPGIAKRVTDAVHDGDGVPESVLDKLAADIRHSRQRLLSWRNNFDMTMVREPQPKNISFQPDKRLEHLGTFLVTISVLGRMLQAISPSQRDLLEDEVLVAAQEIEKLKIQVATTNYPAAFYLAQKSLIADATVATTQSWRNATFSGRIIEKEVFDDWCRAIPRKTA